MLSPNTMVLARSSREIAFHSHCARAWFSFRVLRRPVRASGRPGPADRFAAIPSDGGRSNPIEDAPARLGHMGHLDDRSRIAFVAEIDEAAAGAVALLADLIARGQRPFQAVVVV